MKNPNKLINYFGSRGWMKFIPDRIYLKIIYRARMGSKLKLSNPITFNEKIQWLKIYNKNPVYTQLVDKYEVRKHIEETIGKEYLIPLLGVYDSVDEIDFDALPNQFVLKCTHDSGSLVLCKNKKELDIPAIKRKLNNSLKRNYYYTGRERPYKNVKPRLVCEKYMEDESETELKDYKFMCFNGKVKCSFVCTDRRSNDGLKVTFFDLNWKEMPFTRHYPKSQRAITKPLEYNRMIALSEILSKGIPFVRLDFYEIDGKIYFGEFTFSPGSGMEEFSPANYDELLGSWITIPEVYI